MRARPKVMPAFRDQRGGTLLFAVTLIAVVLILATAAAPFLMRDLDQKRRRTTERLLQDAFHGLFPGSRKARASLYVDFGFTPTDPGSPPAHFYDLRVLVDRSQVGALDPSHAGVPQATGTNGPAWNGPYWQGPVDPQGRPVDGWGRPLQLRCIHTVTPPGWHVFSLGSNGRDDTGDAAFPAGDDLIYPVPPYVPPPGTTLCAAPPITFLMNGVQGAEQATFTLVTSRGTQVVTALFNQGHPEGMQWNPATKFTQVPTGTWTLAYQTNRGRTGTLTVRILSDCSVQPTPLIIP